MRTAELARAALRDILRRPLRNTLAALGIALATATLVALLGLSRGLEHQVLDRAAQQPLLTLVQVFAAAPPAGGTARPLDDRAVADLGAISGVREALPAVVLPATLSVAGRTPGGTVLGLAAAGRAPYALQSGRAIRADDADVAVLTPAGARGLGLDANDAIGRQFDMQLRRGDTRSELRTLSLRVVGVAADDLPGQLAVLPLATAQDALAWIATGESDSARDLRLAQQAISSLLLGGRVVPVELAASRYTAVWLIADSPAHLREVVGRVQALGFSAFSSVALAQTVEDVFRLIDAGLGAISLVALAVAFLGVVNAMLTSVSERTAEIGLLKAIGADDGVVERLFLAQAAIVGAAAGVAGVGIGWVLAASGAALARRLAGSTLGLDPRVDGALAVAAVGIATLVSLAAGWLPARRAARLLPAEALRTE